MLSNTKLNKIKSLHQRKMRKKHSLFMAEGEKLVSQLLLSNKYVLRDLFIVDKNQAWLSKIKHKVNIHFISYEQLKKISSFNHPKDVVALFDLPPEIESHEKIFLHGHCLLLDHIQDPGNMGTIIRTCVWFGFKKVILYGHCADVFNPKVIHASAGTIGDIEYIYVRDKPNHMIENPLFILETGHRSIQKTSFNEHGIFVLGNEGNGVSKDLLSLAHKRLSIEGKSNLDSLNVASAAAILCYELSKIR